MNSERIEQYNRLIKAMMGGQDNSENANNAILKFLGVVLLIPLAWIYNILSNGFVAVKLWAWFVVPVFHPDITVGILQAAGIVICVRFFTMNNFGTTDPEESSVKKYTNLVIVVVYPWAALLGAYLLKSIM